MALPHIAVSGLTHVYRSSRPPLKALEDVGLEIGHGEFTAIIGPSGGGKTTLLKAIGGILHPTEGAVLIGGQPPEESRRRKDIGFVFQDPSLLPWRNVIGNVMLPLELSGNGNRADLRDAEALIEAVGLAEFRDYYPHQLSGGMKQRVAFARALAPDPSVLLMDEPLGALDEITRAEMRYELLRVWEGSSKTVVLVTHSIAEAVMMSDVVAVMSPRPGRILDQVAIDLPRPREESLERSAQFLEYARRVKDILSSGVSLGATAS